MLLIKNFSLYLITFFLGFLIPKKKALVIISASRGKYYNGNAKALFEYAHHSSNLEVYYFISSRELYSELSRKIDNIIFQYSLRGLWLFLRAKTVCVTHGLADFLGYSSSPFQNWIYLSHGSGTKALGYLKEKLSLQERIELFLGRKWYYIVPSDFVRYMFSARYHVKPKRVVITGMPRTDCLYGKKDKISKRKAINILYAPTYRKDKITKIFPFSDFNVKKFISLLEDLNINIQIRFHPNNYRESKEEINKLIKFSNRIIDASQDIIPEVQELLPKSDVLITDFSSISRDYLFLDRPMIFIMNGLEKIREASTLLRKEFLFCGYKISSYKEFEDTLKEIVEGGDPFSTTRKFVRDFSYNYYDDKSSERVVKFIKEIA